MDHGLNWRPSRKSFGLPGGRLIALTALALAFVVGGCASRKQVFLIQEDTQRIRTDIDTLKQQQAVAQQSLNTLSDEVRDVRTKSEYGSSALQDKVEALTARLDEIMTRMDRTLAPLEEFIRQQATQDTSAQGGNLGVDYFDAAQRDLSMGNYDLAEVGFLQFLENYPKSDLADDARYGLAESYYARGRYDDAIEDFERVVRLNPKGGKAPAAMLKMGLSYREKQDNRQAKRIWEDLVKQFPYAEEAKVAQQRLDELKNR